MKTQGETQEGNFGELTVYLQKHLQQWRSSSLLYVETTMNKVSKKTQLIGKGRSDK